MTASTLVTCTIPVTVFRTAPYSFEWGSSIYAKVIATNIYGDSVESNEGNGAVITTTPDAPINLVEVYEQRTKSTIGLTWEAASFIGGAVIEDYRINIAIEGEAFSVLADGLLTPDYLAIDLTFGVTYQFKVESRNSYSYSPYSETITLLCAFKPDPPLVITTTNTNDLVTVNWDDPIWNRYVIHAYRFFFLEHDGVTYTEETLECDGTNANIVNNRQCQIALLTLRSEPYNLV
jgi:hypothetical protein